MCLSNPPMTVSLKSIKLCFIHIWLCVHFSCTHTHSSLRAEKAALPKSGEIWLGESSVGAGARVGWKARETALTGWDCSFGHKGAPWPCKTTSSVFNWTLPCNCLLCHPGAAITNHICTLCVHNLCCSYFHSLYTHQVRLPAVRSTCSLDLSSSFPSHSLQHPPPHTLAGSWDCRWKQRLLHSPHPHLTSPLPRLSRSEILETPTSQTRPKLRSQRECKATLAYRNIQ